VEREKTIQRATQLINQGVDILDPMKLDIRGSLKCGKNVKIDINVIIEGDVILDDNVIIDSNCILKDSVIGSDSKIQANSIVESADIGESCLIGPYARIRPGSILKNHVQIGNFVEIKATMIDTGCKINHLSYIGDAILEKNVIIGAGSITCNFDGTKNNDTYIEKGAFIGSSVQLVAPVRVGENACIGAGSTITEDVPANELTVARSRQAVIKGKRPPISSN
jgi:bifunctional UDP-N-acetylglucosamine pyrophosphorylase/glucosamine-1-phosphate N-acetyltransferase|tara:strand:- start:76 stop:744 length:669 start_codon:yes stop_codon:yes gene_type:complete